MFRAILNEKIGNIIRFYAAEIPNLSLTKLLKLLYLTDELAMRETGVPITWLEYRAWKKGPVPAEIYQEIKFGERRMVGDVVISLDQFIEVKRQQNHFREQEEVTINAIGNLDKMLFSEYELELFKRILSLYGTKSTNQLIDLLHEKDTLWHKIVVANSLKRKFELYQNTSNHIIDFSDLIGEDEFLKMAAQSAFEALYFSQTIDENTFEFDQY